MAAEVDVARAADRLVAISAVGADGVLVELLLDERVALTLADRICLAVERRT